MVQNIIKDIGMSDLCTSNYLQIFKDRLVVDSLGNEYKCVYIESNVRTHEFSDQLVVSHSIECQRVEIVNACFYVGVYLQLKDN